MNNKNIIRWVTPARWSLFCITAYLLVILHLFIKHNGGTQGDNLPWVISCWGMMFLLIAGCWWQLSVTSSLIITPMLKGIVAGCLLLTLPIFWSPHTDWKWHALPRLLGLWGGVAIYFTLLQCRLNTFQQRVIWHVIAVSGLIQGLVVFSGIYFPSILPVLSQRAIALNQGYGIFQQRNVTASFVATGLAMSLYLITAGGRLFLSVTLERMRLAILFFSVVLLSSILVLLYSRTGWLGGILSAVAMNTLVRLPRFKYLTTPFLRKALLWLVCIGVVIGIMLNTYSQGSLNIAHEGSDGQRWRTIIASLHMIAQAPLIGWGYGGFEYTFQHWVAEQRPPLFNAEMMNHPHNEVLFWGVEGGIVSIAGLVIIIATVFRELLKRNHAATWLLLITMLPIVLHTQTEYPLYLSTAHWLILILLITGIERRMLNPAKTLGKWHNCGRWLISPTALFFTTLACVALHNELQLTSFELRTLPDDGDIIDLPFPWLSWERYQQDLALLDIVRFEQEHNSDDLRDAVVRIRRWQQTRIDADMYNNLINIEIYLGDNEASIKDKQEAHALFSYDPRFEMINTDLTHR